MSIALRSNAVLTSSDEAFLEDLNQRIRAEIDKVMADLHDQLDTLLANL